MGLKQFTNLQIQQSSVSQIVLPDAYVPGARSNAEQTVTVNDFAIQDSLTPDTTPAPVEVLVEEITIPGGGSYEIDLTLAKILGSVSGGAPAASEDLSGKKLMYIELHTGSANAAAITVAPSGSNGYDLFGAAIADGVKLPADSHLSLYVKSSALDDVGATDKGITFTGTSGDTINVVMVFEA